LINLPNASEYKILSLYGRIRAIEQNNRLNINLIYFIIGKIYHDIILLIITIFL